MPIRFRCAYCNKLMGIARRKAGHVVRCPQCAGQVIVPTPGAEVPEPPRPDKAPRPQPAGGLFEQGDFDKDILKQPSQPVGKNAGRNGGAAGGQSPYQAPQLAGGGVREAIDVEAVSLPPSMGKDAQDTGLQLSTPVALGLGALIVVLLALAFFVGLLLGRSSGG